MLDPKQFRDNPKAIAKYLNAAFEKSDLNGILDAIKIVMQAQNVTELAEVKGCAGMASTKLSDAEERILSNSSVLVVVASINIINVLHRLFDRPGEVPRQKDFLRRLLDRL